jgi:hypothetical protein
MRSDGATDPLSENEGSSRDFEVSDYEKLDEWPTVTAATLVSHL